MTGTRNVMSTGYVRVHAPGHPMAQKHGWALEHRMVAYEAGLLGAGDPRQVHHKNHDKLDNRLSNLAVVTTEQHGHHHRDIDRGEVESLYLAGLTTIEVGSRVGTHAGNVSRMLAERSVPVRPNTTKADEDLIAEMLEFGVPARVVQAHLHVGWATVKRVQLERGTSPRRSGRPSRADLTLDDFYRTRSAS
jgi:hypothetical protein